MDKTVRLLLAFGDGKPRGVRELARELDIPRSTVSRLVIDLAAARLIVQDEATDLYRLGAGVVRLGAAYLDGIDVTTVATPFMEALQEDCGESVGLQVREGLERVVVASRESKATIRSGFSLGERFPLYAGAAAKVLLAFEPNDVRDGLVQSLEPKPLTDRTILDPELLRSELEQIRLRGYAVSANEVSLQSASIAAPVLSGNGRVAAALVVTGPAFRVSNEVLEALAPRVMQDARTISQRLGASI